MNRKPRPKNSESYSNGHEYTIDHPRRDIVVRRVWVLRARALVLNERHGTNSLLVAEHPPAVRCNGMPEFRQETHLPHAEINTRLPI